MRIPSAGERVGKYFVVEPIGEGAMGVVVRAYDPDLERSVAIKVVQPRVGDAARTEASRARLLNEARALARVSHPNVVSVYEVGLHDGLIFVAMELVDGVDLQRWLKQRPRTWREVVDAFEAAGRGLHQVHLAGLVHRDVKPANILVGNDGRVRIGDFGIARASFELPAPVIEGLEPADGFDLDTTALTAEGRVVGTLAYMAPEQHAGGDVGPAADQYAFCVALYEALWNKRPFATDMVRLLAAKVAGPTPPVAWRGVPRWLYPIVARGLQRDPKDRFPTMVELCDALRRDPAARRRRIAGAAGAAIAVTAAIVVVVTRPGPCDEAIDPLAGVWDPPTRAAVEEVFTQSERPWAPEAWAFAGPTLDAYAAEWTAMRRDACEARHVRGDQSAELFDRRTVCLEARRRGLAATTELLVDGRTDAIDHAFDLVGRLRSIAPCADPVALASAVEPPDATLLADVDQLRAELARARTFVSAGRHVEAGEVAHESSAKARDVGYAPVVAEALAFEGETRLRVGDTVAARALLEESLWIAIGVGHDESAVDAASNLVWLSGALEQSYVEALRWAELARATIRRRHSQDPLELVQLENAIGSAQINAAKFDEGLQTFERALARIADDPTAIARAATLRHNIAKQWLDRGELAKAREVLEPTIAALESELGKDHPNVVAMRGTLGQVLGSAGDHVRAAELFRAEVDGLRIAFGDDSLQVAYARSNLAVELAALGDSDDAIATGETALGSFERAGDSNGAATCLVNLADEYLKRGAYDAAGQRFGRALALLEEVYPDGRHPELGYPLVGLGRVRNAQGRFAEAIASFDRAIDIIRGSESPGERSRALALDGKGFALLAADRVPEALVVLAEHVELMRVGTDVSDSDLPLALWHHAHALLRARRLDEALVELDEALTLSRDRALDRPTAIVETERARVLAGLHRLGDARTAAAAAVAAAERTRPRDPALVADAKATLATLANP